MQRLLLKAFCFLFIFFLIVLYNVTPVIAQVKSDCSFPKLLLVGYNKEGSKLGDLYQQKQTRFKLKSENVGLCYSLLGTFVPIGTGILIWILDEPYYVEHDRPDRYGGDWLEKKDPSRVIPVALIASGLIVGPSMGYFYAGESWRGFKGVAIRLGTGGITVLCMALCYDSDLDNYATLFGGIGFISSIVFLIDVIYDIAKVKSTVRKHNLALHKTALILAPRYFVDSKACGVGLQIKF
ncbi:MAG TPA: hypothetical protein VGB16_06765 [candidate division Zixibacteria bacterium]